MLTVAAIMLDEADYVRRWADGLRWASRDFKKVVVVDGGSADDTVSLLEEATADFSCPVEILHRAFPMDFADQRYFAMQQCGPRWVLMVDADETVSTALLGGLGANLREAERRDIDVIGIPRLNFIDDQLVASPGTRGLDFQYRLMRSYCAWEGKVHETPIGVKGRIELEIVQGHFILHDKKSARHIERNALYDTMAVEGG